ncbi:hypothetical protein [Pleomorphomonas koreensis]|uniref:hypothetical protein n=1 Tax=Pleomorphomonas koreensis TaxID=257440 RepID=UPI0004069229|nr:hypothetical protein [Pleomorphomonas koreensis]
MAPLSEIRIPHDMLRRRLVDVVPFCLRDVCGLLATALLGAGMASWAIALTSQSLGG